MKQTITCCVRKQRFPCIYLSFHQPLTIMLGFSVIVIRGNMANERGNKRFWTTYSPLLYAGRQIQAQNKVVRRASWQKRFLAFCCSITTRFLCFFRDTSPCSPTIVCRLEWNVGVYKYLEELYTFVFCNILSDSCHQLERLRMTYSSCFTASSLWCGWSLSPMKMIYWIVTQRHRRRHEKSKGDF